MANKTTSTTESDVRGSVSTLYADILNQRKAARAERQSEEEKEREARKAAKKAAKVDENGQKISKKERREAEFNQWSEVIVGLTGDDLDYSSPKKKGKKKKYTKWIGDEETQPLKPKNKKPKKKNYRREFAPELNMLRTMLADQNRFGTELQRRFQIAAGPASKDGMPLNKTLVDLAAAVNTARGNSLSYLNAISNIKKTVADLYMKQAKMDADGGSVGTPTDPALVGSSIAASLLGDNPYLPVAPGAPILTQPGPAAVAASTPPTVPAPNPYQATSVPASTGAPQAVSTPVGADGTEPIEDFDPESWEGEGLNLTPEIISEKTPHTFMLEWNKATDARRFVAVDDATGKIMPDCPVPTSDPYRLKINEKDLTVKGEFDESFKVILVE
ncbi:MAG: hypothetical protein NC131_10010 [Roseburia sp.]|nr:hypothetical protein [Roseburia sp.]